MSQKRRRAEEDNYLNCTTQLKRAKLLNSELSQQLTYTSQIGKTVQQIDQFSFKSPQEFSPLQPVIMDAYQIYGGYNEFLKALHMGCLRRQENNKSQSNQTQKMTD
eukprot:TRINITY_DN583_c1_g1_i1.p3 TRINITY_DN583_c1_g1~~TRINITY_DN583_c1_g1_i1.p3  ORF type:complete len:106 (-),score=7.11 TRINITY_DN583_c1_g1_i1:484-801(-)